MIQEARGDFEKVDWKQHWIIQPKIDGVRGEVKWCTKTWQYQVYSKAGNILPRCHFSGLIKELFDAGLLSRTRTVDGEIFCGDWERTNGLIHSKEKRPDLQMTFHIFDIIDKNSRSSLATRQKLLPRKDGRWFKVVKSYPVKSAKDAIKYMHSFLAAGGTDGAVMKDLAGKYGQHNTWVKLKKKETVDVAILAINYNDAGAVISITCDFKGKALKVKCDYLKDDDMKRLINGQYTVAEVEHTGDFKFPALKRLRSDKKIMGLF